MELRVLRAVCWGLIGATAGGLYFALAAGGDLRAAAAGALVGFVVSAGVTLTASHD